MMTRRKIYTCLILGVLLSLCTCSLVMAQQLNARIRGTITDPSGAVVPDVKIIATNVDKNISREMASGTDGSFDFLQLQIGNYKVTAEKAGFKTFVTTGIKLMVNQVFVVNITMEVGQVTTEVAVQANAAQVETTNMQLGGVVTGDAIRDLPLNGRNWVQLQQLQPGVVGASDRFGTNYATNGSQSQQNSYMVNGTDANDLPLNTPLIIVSPDAIAEFRLVTNTLNPEFGRNSGAILNAVTRGGTNAFHGSAFEFFRDTSLNARNFFGAPGQAVIFHQNQFGGTVGGPIKKDKAFFFFSYQGTRNRNPGGGGSVTVFSTAERGVSFQPSPHRRGLLLSRWWERMEKLILRALLTPRPAAQKTRRPESPRTAPHFFPTDTSQPQISIL